MNYVKFREPIRIHTQGHYGDLVATDSGGGCGDLEGTDCIGMHFEGEGGVFVVSLADLRQAVRAIDIELDQAKEDAERRASEPSGAAGEPK